MFFFYNSPAGEKQIQYLLLNIYNIELVISGPVSSILHVVYRTTVPYNRQIKRALPLRWCKTTTLHHNSVLILFCLFKYNSNKCYMQGRHTLFISDGKA